ncbi:hypothetical protein [Actinokineospora globicatena]|uniref:hypothetical protein n=1 Tax=Actinokineospora globicatena TaxID=103729 RepID=UPI0020A52AFA|nr:hypothetical protein [Actinokineospora globicatena]MCP2302298.1 ABC-2 type transport system permease protein [Actinokineospora globicatena]GLW76035.1 hypothetical protein Aglo01_05170 [Actinokineospora globicatena]GLW82871.1 hypothetical protein Aglo02_05110 [Actinokineospora globicatena]
MVGVLIRMKLAVLRHTIAGPKATWMLTGGLVGLVIAAGTIGLATTDAAPGTVADLLAVTFAIWALGWMLGPSFGGDPVLRAEQFAMEPVPRTRLALGLLGAAFVGVTTVVTLVAFTALVVFAARFGAAAVVVSIPALALQLTLVVLLSRLAARFFGALARSRTGAAVTAVITATMMVLSQSGWIVFVALDVVLETGFSRAFSLTVRALPSGWGVVAVEAAARGDWLWVVGPLVALAVLVALLVVLWGRVLGPQRLARPVVRGSSASSAAKWADRGPVAAVYVKEVRTWLRDPLRVQGLLVAPVFAILSGLLPVLFGSTALLPFVGAITALLAATTTANLYGQDGTALWLTLMTPGTELADVRGRQLAWLTWFGPLSVVLTVVGTAIHGGLWPWAIAATTAVLGGGAGLVVLVAVDQLVPGPDPHKAKNSPLEHGDVTGQGFVTLFLVLGAASPALCVVLAGELLDLPLLAWAGGPAGVLTGIVGYGVLGGLAAKRLAARGPELLYLMRAGKEHEAALSAETSVIKAMSRHRRGLLWTSFFIGCLATFPQGLVPLGMKLSGEIERVWFLALYLPEGLQWPVIALMLLIGLSAFGLAGWVYLVESRKLKARLERTAEERERVEEPVAVG